MAKRTKKTGSANEARKWSTEEELHLLAWLDHCIKNEENFDATVVTHMKTKTQRALTEKQCKDKVNRIWQCYGSYGSKVWLEGSSSLECLLEEEKQRIRQLCYELDASSLGVQHDDKLPEEEIEKQTRLIAEKEARIKEQQYQIFNLENDLSATRSYYEKLLRRLENRSDPIHNPEFLYKLQNDNTAIRRKLEHARESQSNELRIKEDTLGPATSEICRDLYRLEDRVATACSAFGCSTSTIEPLPETPVRLRELIARVSGMSIQQFNAHMVSTGISGRNLFRSLAAALLCELGFEPSFPEPLDVGSLLLHEYREQVLIQGDRSALECLDFLAHKSLFSNPYFVSNVIPEKACGLASEVIQLLAEWNSHGTQDQSLDLGSDAPKEELFQSIFTKALALKVQLLLSKSRYTLVFPAPGTSFDPVTMRRHTDEHSPRRSSLQLDLDESPVQPKKGDELVKLCLFPALYAYPKQPDKESIPPQEVDSEKHVVNYRNFFVNEDGLMTGEPVVVSKAVVLL
ncbi:hypothetical protein F4818DRAFT_451978 [Hypoxylon cercidicola]|nr:hypothetical protein F4818DRAFT_451978 [Hypoxylon cercidicola]